MLALYRCRRQADALEVYRDAHRTMVDELGIEPGVVLRKLEQAILRQDPSLELEPRRPERLAPDALPDPVADRWLQGERRPVTAVFVDVPRPPLGDRDDPEALRVEVERVLELVGDVLRRHGAGVEEQVGDVLVGLFGVPTAHEDDALRAVRAVDELRGAVRDLSEAVGRERRTRLTIRAGVETGEAARRTVRSKAAVNRESSLARPTIGRSTWSATAGAPGATSVSRQAARDPPRPS